MGSGVKRSVEELCTVITFGGRKSRGVTAKGREDKENRAHHNRKGSSRRDSHRMGKGSAKSLSGDDEEGS